MRDNPRKWAGRNDPIALEGGSPGVRFDVGGKEQKGKDREARDVLVAGGHRRTPELIESTYFGAD